MSKQLKIYNMKKLIMMMTLMMSFSLSLTSCKKEKNEPITVKTLNVVDSLSITGYVSKDSAMHNFYVQYLSNITVDTLVLEDNVGNSTPLDKISPTTFSSTNFIGVEGRTYIRTAFKVFLTQNGLNLQKLVDQNFIGNYGTVYAKINQCHISHEYIEGLARLVQPSAKLEKFGSSFMFTFKNK